MPKLPALKTIHLGDRKLQALHDAVKEALHPVLNSPEAKALYLGPYDISVGNDVTVYHNFGHKANGWRITDVNAAVHIYKHGENTSSLLMRADGTATFHIKVW